ncbi:hypothetical protein OCU04_005562 [Sclerotinia nivalis]|uniref:Uncharacterized protein n=1 Tax=Sclerotinia nivalis TaxID=352851 RepID=A0A9X0AQ54_9HELO|nr:hypothetical protein OCU04_005562 [Sclerotinia nivalis]
MRIWVWIVDVIQHVQQSQWRKAHAKYGGGNELSMNNQTNDELVAWIHMNLLNIQMLVVRLTTYSKLLNKSATGMSLTYDIISLSVVVSSWSLAVCLLNN